MGLSEYSKYDLYKISATMEFYPGLSTGTMPKLYNHFYERNYPYSSQGYDVQPPVRYTPPSSYYTAQEKRYAEKIYPRMQTCMKTPPNKLKPQKMYKFSSQDLEAVLYGYLCDENNTSGSLHSLSGVQLDRMMTSTPKDSILEPKASTLFHPELPPSLTIKEVQLESISHKGVFATETIPIGTRFGPYVGSIMNPRDHLKKCNCSHSWEVYDNDKISHMIDGSQNQKNWMKFVNCARYKTEQNLILMQTNLELHYETTVEIKAGEELLVWYGNDYVKYMGVPLSLTKDRTESKREEVIKEPIAKAVHEVPAGSYPCKRCGKIFSYEYYREKHLKYTRCVDMGDRKFPCHLCQRSFEKKDRLRIHVLHVHQKYRPHVCTTCGKRFSQSSSLNKHSRVHTGERPYSCPHCPKSFTASSILRTHLRQHNGERPFKCKFCGKAFASHAAHDSHVRRTHDKLKTCACKICGKTFSMEFELKFHLSTHTTEEISILAAKESLRNMTMEGEQRDMNEKFDESTNLSVLSERSDNSLIIDM